VALVVQPSLFGSSGELGVAELGAAVERRRLSDGAWIDLRPGFVTAADELFDALAGTVPWHEERMHMYDSTVRVPRLLARYAHGEDLPHPVLDEARSALNAHYTAELGEPFVSAGLCLYRDGNDSVAWHGDTIGRGSEQDTMVAILSLGTPRALLLRPLGGGGPALRHDVGHGDLLVMGGSCQRTWQHAIPKTARCLGARISIQFRPRWGNDLDRATADARDACDASTPDASATTPPTRDANATTSWARPHDRHAANTPPPTPNQNRRTAPDNAPTPLHATTMPSPHYRAAPATDEPTHRRLPDNTAAKCDAPAGDSPPATPPPCPPTTHHT